VTRPESRSCSRRPARLPRCHRGRSGNHRLASSGGCTARVPIAHASRLRVGLVHADSGTANPCTGNAQRLLWFQIQHHRMPHGTPVAPFAGAGCAGVARVSRARRQRSMQRPAGAGNGQPRPCAGDFLERRDAPRGRLAARPAIAAAARFAAEAVETCGGTHAVRYERRGTGRIAGVSARSRSLADPPSAALPEGDERTQVDGRPSPLWHDTGVEVCFDGGLHFDHGAWTSPLAGASRVRDGAMLEAAAWRLLPTDPLDHVRSLRLVREVGLAAGLPVPACVRGGRARRAPGPMSDADAGLACEDRAMDVRTIDRPMYSSTPGDGAKARAMADMMPRDGMHPDRGAAACGRSVRAAAPVGPLRRNVVP